MKFKIVFSLIIVAFLSACSSDNSSGNSNVSGNYLPLTTGNYWNYNAEGQTTGSDSLYVANDTLINSNSYKKMKTNLAATGFFSNALRNNGLKNNGDLVQLSGDLGFDLGLNLPINLAVSNFVILKSNASANEQLSITNGTFTQDFATYPLTITYSLKSVSDGSLPTFTSPDGTTYNDIIKSKIILNLKVTTTTVIPGTSFPFTLTILDSQDVVAATQYYSKNIGMVYNKTAINYNLNAQAASLLQIPANGSQTQEEFLDTYSAN